MQIKRENMKKVTTEQQNLVCNITHNHSVFIRVVNIHIRILFPINITCQTINDVSAARSQNTFLFFLFYFRDRSLFTCRRSGGGGGGGG